MVRYTASEVNLTDFAEKRKLAAEAKQKAENAEQSGKKIATLTLKAL